MVKNKYLPEDSIEGIKKAGKFYHFITLGMGNA
jgi:hypothetical protein